MELQRDWIPDSIVIKPTTIARGGYAFWNAGFVRCNQASAFSTFAKIDVETSTINSKFVHLRFRHTNRYWSGRDGNGFLVANTDRPEEDLSKDSCTLFEANMDGAQGIVTFRHVQSGGDVGLDNAVSGELSHRLRIFPGGGADNRMRFNVVNLLTLMQLPKRVTFRGDNERFLNAFNSRLEFTSADPNQSLSAFEIELHDDRHVRIKSVNVDRYLRRNPGNNMVEADSSDSAGNDVNTLFWPVLIRGNNYAFWSAGNNFFCGLQGVRLSAMFPTMNRLTTLLLQELILQRHVYHIKFRMDQARIYDEEVIIAGTGTSVNNTDSPSTMTITVTYAESRSYSFTNSLANSSAVTLIKSVNIPRILGTDIDFANETTKSFEWGETVENTITSEASVTVTVPSRSGVRVDYVATKGTCSIPFSYTVQDKSSVDGEFINYSDADGMFTGVNYYSFHFDQHAVPRFTPATST